MDEKTELVCVGAIAGAFGVRGEVRVKSFTVTPEDIFDYAPWRSEAGAPLLTVSSWRHVKDGFAVYCDEVVSREEAMAMKSTRLYAPREALPTLGEEEYYYNDLIGLAVKDLSGRPLGLVRAVHNFGADDLLEIWKTPGAKGGWYLPFTREAAPKVDLAHGEVIADPPPELLPDFLSQTEETANGAPDQDDA